MRGDAARRACGHAPGHLAMPKACHFGSNNLLFQKTLIFWETSQGQGMQQPRPRQPPMGTQPRPRQPMGMQQPRPTHAAAKAKACSSQGLGSPPWACSSQGLGSPHRHAAAKALAAPHGHAAAKGHGSPPWARSQGMQQPRPRHAAAKA